MSTELSALRSKCINWLTQQKHLFRDGKLAKDEKLAKDRQKLLEQLPNWIWEWKIQNSKNNKEQLLEMAKNGEDKPVEGKHPLGKSLSRYTCKTHCYDPIFNEEIRKLAPHWFINTADDNKKELLEMAKNGEPRPEKRKHLLGKYLSSYTCKSQHSYDPVFDKEIRKIASHWFVSQSEIANIKKQQLLEIAKNKQSIPDNLKRVFWNYICSTSDCYDLLFDKKIRKLAPNLFVKSSEDNKKKLLQMGKRGKQKPLSKDSLYGVLLKYTIKSSSCYDPIFDEEIRSLVPSWFINTADDNKKLLIAMAKNKEKRPEQKRHPLGKVLSHYTNERSSSYDIKFNKQIRELAPYWFIRQTDLASEKKRKLLNMAKSNKTRPKQKKHPLGKVLSEYTNQLSTSYDKVFDKEVRKLAPHWFRTNKLENYNANKR